MTSREALEMIVVDLVPKAKENNKEEIELIEKDLKVFEILKQNLKYDIDGNIVLKIGYKNKDYKVVKELMDNGK